MKVYIFLLLPATVFLYILDNSVLLICGLLLYFKIKFLCTMSFLARRQPFNRLWNKPKTISRNHSWKACRFFSLSSMLLRGSRISSFQLNFLVLRFLFVRKTKREGMTGIRSTDPWYRFSQISPLLHDAPPLYWK